MADEPGAKPAVSVLLPTHNRPETLVYAIRSVLAQTFTDYELLVVGDGCTDSTAVLVGSFPDPRLHWFDLPKAPGVGYANRNLVLRQAQGALIAFMTHDDLWFPDHLLLLKPLFERPVIDLAYSRPLWVSPGGNITPSAFNLHDPAIRAGFLARERNSLPSTCFVCRTDAVLARDGFDESLSQAGDLDLWSRIISAGQQQNFAYQPTPTTLHFRAIWRTDTEYGAPEMLYWLRLHATDGALPAALKLSGQPAELLQATAWRALCTTSPAWVEAARTAVLQVLDGCILEAETTTRLLEGRIAEAERLLLERAASEEAERVLLERLASAEASAQAERRLPFRLVAALGRAARQLFPAQTVRGAIYTRILSAVDRLID